MLLTSHCSTHWILRTAAALGRNGEDPTNEQGSDHGSALRHVCSISLVLQVAAFVEFPANTDPRNLKALYRVESAAAGGGVKAYRLHQFLLPSSKLRV